MTNEVTMSDFTFAPPTHFHDVPEAEQPASQPQQHRFHRNPPFNRQEKRSIQNISTAERIIGGVVGIGLIGLGLKQRSTPGMLAGVISGGAALAMAAAGYCPVHDALGINTARKGTADPADFYDDGIHVEVRYTIAKPAAELFAFWRNFENLPRFMNHLKSVTCAGPNRSHWVAKGPAGVEVEWDAEIINEEPDRLISWRTIGKADVDSAGTVRFLEGREGGTEVHVNMDYIPPVGRVGKALAKIFGDDPQRMIEEDMARFKQLMETGEAARIGQSQGHCG
jgi:uncharacterized membrane protein